MVRSSIINYKVILTQHTKRDEKHTHKRGAWGMHALV